MKVAEWIIRSGFRDGVGTYLTTNTYRGVWVSDRPLDENSGAVGDCVLSLNLPARVFRDHEWVEDRKQYRESLIPATILNRYSAPKVHDHNLAGAAEADLRWLAGVMGKKEGAVYLRAIPFLRKHGLLAGSEG
jgi:hypothetical protein